MAPPAAVDADSVYRFDGGEVKAGRPLIHPLMVLGFDVYGQPVEKTVRQLEALGFDLSKVHEATWQGRPVYVVGADAGDTLSAQFWIDQERLYFVRSIQPDPQKPGSIREIRFDDYVRLGGGWIGTTVRFLADGRLVTTEEYADVRGDVVLDEAMFDPGRWVEPKWIEAGRQQAGGQSGRSRRASDGVTGGSSSSGRQDSNLRLPAPKAGALPD